MAYTLIGGTAVGTLLILLPALYAAWFRITPAADDAHEPEVEVHQRLPKMALLEEPV